jgi:hypothetical protein
MENSVLIVTNFLVIALALFLALVVAAAAANVHGMQRGDLSVNSEFRTTLGPDMPDLEEDEPTVQPAGQAARLQPASAKVVVLGQPLRPEQPPQLVRDHQRRRA